MHELSIIHNVFGIIEETAAKEKLEKVTQVDMIIGKMHQIVPEMLDFAFEAVSMGTKAEGAQLVTDWIDIVMNCDDCNQTFIVQDQTFICPVCGSFRLHQLKGKELYIKSITGE